MASDSSIHVARAISWANEGSGSASDIDFANFLNMSRRSVFEVANILMILSKDKDNYLSAEAAQPLIDELEEQSRIPRAFRRTLKS